VASRSPITYYLPFGCGYALLWPSASTKACFHLFLFIQEFLHGNLGRFTWALDVQIDISDPARTTATGTGVLTAANGDGLFTRFTAFATNTETPDVLFITEFHTITGGTGRFAGATGTFTREALSNLALGFSFGSFDGFISY